MENRDGNAKGRALGALFIGLGVIGILLSVFFFLDYAISRARTMHFQYEGHNISAKIDALNWKTSPFKMLYVSYSYTDALGEMHTGVDLYPFSDGDQLEIGQSIDILYLEYNPGQSRISTHQSLMMIKLKDVPWSLIGYMALGGLVSIAIGNGKRR